ncbi:MAG: hypothetical protein QNJ22_20955 [Desulfosarcinaceae bacterium]|nr:hypothetical protein [Desulfosarcinaceae bacterium]
MVSAAARHRFAVFENAPSGRGPHTWLVNLYFSDGEGIRDVLAAGVALPRGRQIDVQGCLITPGLVDLHCDAIEKCVEIRPKVFFDADFAISHLDHRLATCGITTFCHAISFSDHEIGLRSSQAAADLVARINAFGQGGWASVHHRMHVRCDVHSPISMNLVSGLIDRDLVDLLSIRRRRRRSPGYRMSEYGASLATLHALGG